MKRLSNQIEYIAACLNRLPEWQVSAAAIFLLAFSAFAHVLLRPALSIGGGDLLIYYFWEHFTREQLSAGHLPLWNPYILSGYPAVGNPQVMIFYPPAALLRLLPLGYAFGVGYMMHIGWLGLGTYWLMRWNGYRRSGAYVTAVLFMFSGFVAPRIDAGHVDLLYSASWLPWAIGLWQKTLQTGSWRLAVLSAAVIGLHFLGGHPATLTLTLGLLVIATGHWVVLHFRQLRRAEFLARAGLGALAALVVMGGFAFQLLPSIQLVRLSTHAQGLLRDCGLPFALTLPDLSSIALAAIPFDVFLPWERNGYFGALALIMAMIAFTVPAPTDSKRLKPFLVIALAVGLLFGFNPSLPFLPPDTHLLPPVSSFRVPSRFMLYVCLAGAALAGMGFESLVSRLKAGQAGPRWPIVAALALAALALPADGYYVVHPQIDYAQSPMYVTAFYILAGLSAPRYLLAGVVFWLFSRPRAAKIAIASAALFFYADLWLFGHPYIHAAPEASPSNPSGQVQSLDAADARIVVEPYMFANGAMAVRVANAQGYASIIPLAYADLVDNTPPAARCGSVEHANLSLADRHMLKLLSVKYVISATGPIDIGLPPVQASVNVYELPEYWPRAQVVGRVEIASTESEAIAMARDEGFDPTRSVVVEANARAFVPTGNVDLQGASAKIADYGALRVVLKADSLAEAMLVLNDVWYPGWRADVNGVESPVYRANGAFRAVPIPAGHSVVTLTFRSDALVTGWVVSLLTWGSVAAVRLADRFGLLRRTLRRH